MQSWVQPNAWLQNGALCADADGSLASASDSKLGPNRQIRITEYDRPVGHGILKWRFGLRKGRVVRLQYMNRLSVRLSMFTETERFDWITLIVGRRGSNIANQGRLFNIARRQK